MKLPKNFGFGSMPNMGDLMSKAQDAMARAQKLEEELADERLEIVKGPVRATFDGRGAMVALKVDPTVVDPDDLEMLEDMIVSLAKDGFEKAVEIRDRRVAEIKEGLPDIPGF